MLDNLRKYDIILASNSPRRRELLKGLGVEFRAISLPDIDESYPENLKGGDIPAYISEQKSNSYKEFLEDNTLLITADTIVWLGDKQYGKPADAEDAKCMLKELSGNTHTVYTGVTLLTKDKSKTFISASDVKFATLSDEEIDYYVDTFSPMDKAGAYGIQEWIGYIGVESINGSYFNVMGLPIQRLYRELKEF
ncbi:MAG: septum formation protein Maf [Muribaculaceae bacterium]|nr:septum formation protein Maf [Muribaculaceae bacterium]